jgi:L-asparagine transporter-like permease
LASIVFIIVIGAIILALNFSPAIFSILFQLFIFMILLPYGMTYVYLVYKDAKSLKEGKEPHKDFVDESEKLFIVLLIIAAVTALIFFCTSTFGRWDVHLGGTGTFTSRRSNSGYMMNNSTMMYGRQYNSSYNQSGY